MSKPNKHNAFKEIIPKESLTEDDKRSVLKTIQNAKLFMEVFDLFSVKHVQTQMEVLKTIGGDSTKTN